MTGWELFAVAATTLFFKHVVTVFIQAGARMQTGKFRHPEDAMLLNAQLGDPPMAERGQALIRNSMENEPVFLLLLFCYFSLNTDGNFDVFGQTTRSATTYVQVFIGARVFHALFFLGRKGGWRTAAYGVGLLATIGIAVQTLLEVFD